MSKKPTRSLRDEIRQIMRDDPMCAGADDALRTIGLVTFAGGISRVRPVGDNLCLKGGTLLRLLTNGSIGRPPSKDLDGTLFRPDGFESRQIETDVVDAANDILSTTFRERVILTARRPEQKEPADGGTGVHLYVYLLAMQAFGLNGNPKKVTRAEGNAFKFDLCDDELVMMDLLDPLKVEHYGISLDLLVYAPLQSLAEKLRAILQKHQHYDSAIAKGHDPIAAAGSFAPRHVLDLEIIIRLLPPGALGQLPPVFTRKCEARNIPMAERTFERLTNPIMEGQVRAECARLPRDFDRCWGMLIDLARRVTAYP